ncbi:MAG TPA: GNAT family N-acetyltransferase [Pseudolabrys sp.]|nr:GNAT family N-acetyltransferase [Pseudolabrys sp.]
MASRAEAAQCRHWLSAFGAEAKDRRYYELLEDTIHREFEYRYFIVRDWRGEICAIQPFFIVDQDLLVGTKPLLGRLTSLLRRLWPRFMRTRTLMMGCAAGEGHLDGDESTQGSSAQLLASAIVKEARHLKARIIVLKEFPARYRRTLECFVDNDFTRIPSLPNVMLDIGYSSFEEYMTRALSGGARRKLRLKLRAADQAAPIEMSVVEDVALIIDEVYPLYLQVYERSTLHFEKLTKEYFCGLGHRMSDKNRFFVWRQNGKIVAFGSCLVQGDMIHAEYLGLDYTVALDLHLYHYTFRDLIGWGIANGYKWFHSSALNYDPKLHLKYRLYPIDLYVRHTSAILNAAFRRILPWIEPTRYDETLKQFANYDELWVPARRGASRPAAAILSRAKQAVGSTLAAWRDAVSPDLRWRSVCTSLGLVAAATVILSVMDLSFDVPHVVFGYLLPVLYVAMKFGRAPALLTAAASGLCAVTFIYEPKLSLLIENCRDMLELACFCAAAFTISQVFGGRESQELAHPT